MWVSSGSACTSWAVEESGGREASTPWNTHTHTHTHRTVSKREKRDVPYVYLFTTSLSYFLGVWFAEVNFKCVALEKRFTVLFSSVHSSLTPHKITTHTLKQTHTRTHILTHSHTHTNTHTHTHTLKHTHTNTQTPTHRNTPLLHCRSFPWFSFYLVVSPEITESYKHSGDYVPFLHLYFCYF